MARKTAETKALHDEIEAEIRKRVESDGAERGAVDVAAKVAKVLPVLIGNWQAIRDAIDYVIHRRQAEAAETE